MGGPGARRQWNPLARAGHPGVMPPDKGSKRTQSELDFEEFCAQNGLVCEAIETGSDVAPDYEVSSGATKIIVEVTQLDPNEEDLEAERQLRETGMATVGGTAGSRLREKIGHKYAQIKSRADGKYPGLLIVENMTISRGHTGEEVVRAAMYGFDSIVIGVPADPAEALFEKDRKFAGGRTVTPTMKRSLSAVGILERDSSGRCGIRIYHNIHSSLPLPVGAFVGPNVRQFSLAEAPKGSIPGWVEIHAEA